MFGFSLIGVQIVGQLDFHSIGIFWWQVVSDFVQNLIIFIIHFELIFKNNYKYNQNFNYLLYIV